MSVNTGRTKLNNALKTLRVHWQDTQTAWNDPVSRDFEETYLLALEPQVAATMRAMDRLDVILSKARQECS